MICIDCLNPCWNIGNFGRPLCCDCNNFVHPNNTRPLCDFCKDFYVPFEIVEEIDSEKIWKIVRG